MLADELQEQLKTIKPDLDAVKLCWAQSGHEERFQQLSAISSQENFWQNPSQASLLKELQNIKNIRDRYTSIIETYSELTELVELFKDDEAELAKIAYDVSQCLANIRRLKISFLLSGEDDDKNCFININSGA